MSHEVQNLTSLELGSRIAEGLPRHPEWVDFALANLYRWSRLNSGTPSLLRCYDEWRNLLGHGIPEICSVLTAETDEGQRLRQNSPFAGILSPAEVWEIKARYRQPMVVALAD